MLPPSTASIYKTSSSEGDGAHMLPPSVNSSSSSPENNSGFFSTVTVLKRAFEIATSQTQVLLLSFFIFLHIFYIKSLCYLLC
jgi:beclin 1